MQLTAHRAFGDRYPENTVHAAREASKSADAVEIDARRCGSGELVASHWENVEWVTDGEGEVGDLSAAELAALRVDDSEWGIPLLSEVVAAIPPDVRLDLDLKERGLVEDVLDLLSGVDNDAVVSAFDPDTLWRTRTLDASVPLALTFDVRPDANLLTAETVGCESVNLHWSLCLLPGVVARVHDAGMDAYAWPVGSRALACLLERAGVDGLIATEPL